MPRQTKASRRRLKESETIRLVAELLKRGARTKTVERLTGLSEIPIRDVYREIFRAAPTKGPSRYSAGHFTASHTIQLQSSLIRVCLDTTHEAQGSPVLPEAPALGYFYIASYDLYLQHLAPLKNLLEPLCFERFAHLAQILAKSSLGVKKCTRCDTPFVAPQSPSASNNRHCPSCRITTARGCAKCNVYVSLDGLDLQPKRRPLCAEHSPKPRTSAYARSQYGSGEPQEETGSVGVV